MGLFDRLLHRPRVEEPPTVVSGTAPEPAAQTGHRAEERAAHPVTGSLRAVVPDAAEETALRGRLEADPNDENAFRRLAEIVRRRAVENHRDSTAAARSADDAVWALAEETARSGRAWFALVEMARLSVHQDRDGALRRLATAAERDPSGRALGEGLSVLREAGQPADALNLGVGHWRPREHDPEVGRQLVQAALEAGRTSEARRYLESFAQHPDQARAGRVRADLERAVAEAAARRPSTGQFPAV